MRLTLLDRWRASETVTFHEPEPSGGYVATRSYIDFEHAYAYARLGNVVRAAELAAAATAALAPAHGSIHGYLRAAYAERVAAAIAGQPAGTVTASEVQYPRLHRDARWPIDRLLADSRVLTHRWIDALGNYTERKPMTIRVDEIRARFGDQSQAYRALLDQVAVPVEPDVPVKGKRAVKPTGPAADTIVFHGVLDGLVDLAPEMARPLLVGVVELLERPNVDPQVYGSALAAALRFEDLVPRVVALICSRGHESPFTFDRVFWRTIRALRARPEIIRELLAAASLKKKRKVEPTGYGMVAARFALGDTADATAMLEAMSPARPLDQLTDGELTGFVFGRSLAYSVAPLEVAMAGLESLFGVYPHVRGFTASPFNHTAIGINSLIALGIVGE